jgi:hypothetical protein
MQLYIKLQNNKPVDHPFTRENMLSAYPEVDLDNLPESWAEFVRVQPPKVGPYEVVEGFYEWVGDVIKDVWYIYPMSPEEKAAKQDRVKRNYIADGGFSNWLFDEERCCHVPPVPMPTDGKPYMWVQLGLVWVEMPLTPAPEHNRPPYPMDGHTYLYNEANNTWIKQA